MLKIWLSKLASIILDKEANHLVTGVVEYIISLDKEANHMVTGVVEYIISPICPPVSSRFGQAGQPVHLLCTKSSSYWTRYFPVPAERNSP